MQTKVTLMVFGNIKNELIDFDCPYRVENESTKECKIWLSGKKMEEAHEFQYFGSILCTYGSLEGETREGAVQRRTVFRSQVWMVKERIVIQYAIMSKCI